MALRLVFMGTPDFSVPTLLEIAGRGHEIAACYTRAPRPAGRGMPERRSPVHEAALGLGIPVLTPKTLRDPAVAAEFAAHEADAAVVVAYGLILPPDILAAPREGCLNLHASLLPRWRGAAPIQRALMAGDAETGVMVMRMEEGLDTGPVCLAERVPIRPEDDAGTLHEALARLGADLMARALAALERGSLACRPQIGPDESDAAATYAAKIDKAEARIDWSLPADRVFNQIRGLAPSPGAWCEMTIDGRPERVKVLKSFVVEDPGECRTELSGPLTRACGTGAIKLMSLQRPGRRPMGWQDFLRGLQAGVSEIR